MVAPSCPSSSPTTSNASRWVPGARKPPRTPTVNLLHDSAALDLILWPSIPPSSKLSRNLTCRYRSRDVPDPRPGPRLPPPWHHANTDLRELRRPQRLALAKARPSTTGCSLPDTRCSTGDEKSRQRWRTGLDKATLPPAQSAPSSNSPDHGPAARIDLGRASTQPLERHPGYATSNAPTARSTGPCKTATSPAVWMRKRQTWEPAPADVKPSWESAQGKTCSRPAPTRCFPAPTVPPGPARCRVDDVFGLEAPCD